MFMIWADFETFYQLFSVGEHFYNTLKNISDILAICDDLSILRFRYMLLSNFVEGEILSTE